MTAVSLNIPPTVKLSPEQFAKICQANSNLRLERTATGELIIMPPTGGGTGKRNLKIAQQLANWADADGTGVAFDSSTGFTLPNGSDRSPDAAWIPLEKWNGLTPEQQEKFLPFAPDFAIELRSPSDQCGQNQLIVHGPSQSWDPPKPPLKRGASGSPPFRKGGFGGDPLQKKMKEYQENGTRLGWLINRQNRQVEIYRQGQEKEVKINPATLSGEDVLPGFSLNMESIW